MISQEILTLRRIAKQLDRASLIVAQCAIDRQVENRDIDFLKSQLELGLKMTKYLRSIKDEAVSNT